MAKKSLNEVGTYEMIFTGVEERKSKGTGNTYYIARFLNKEGKTLPFYVAESMKDEVSVLEQLQQVAVHTKLSEFKGNVKVDLVGVSSL